MRANGFAVFSVVLGMASLAPAQTIGTVTNVANWQGTSRKPRWR
jgi:hypothetical protein